MGRGHLGRVVRSCTFRTLTGAAVYDHEAYLIIDVISGSIEIGNSEYEGSSAFAAFCPEGPVSLKAPESCDFVLLELDPCAMLDLPGCRPLLTEAVTSGRLPEKERFRIQQLLREYMHEEDASESTLLSGLSHILMVLHILSKYAADSVSGPVPLIPLSDRRSELFRSLLDYLDEHRGETLSQAQTAAAFRITPQYLGRFLKETTGMTFREYFGSLNQEEEILRRRYGRLTKTESPLPGIPFSSAPVRGLAEPQSEAHTSHTELRASLSPKHRLKRHWTRLINLGYAINLRNIEIDATLRRIQEECGFEYGRICRITDLILTSRIGERTCHDYSQVFSLLDHLLAAGITPFLELGNKSFLIQETTSINYTPISPIDSRKYFSDLLVILPGFLRACINHYGQENFDKWYFEISYMYTDAEAKETFGLIQYTKIFRKIYSIIRNFSDKCRIGGPGFNDWSSPGKVQQAVRLLSSHNIVPDFFSAYIYPIELTDSEAVLSPDPETAKSRVELFSGTVREFYPDAEIWITEFNSNLSSRNFLNDSCYQSAFLAKMILDTMKYHIAALGYYLLSDAPLRYLDSLDFMFGGWGLFTDMAIPKASWHTYRMMSMLGHYRILQTENALVTANSRGSVRILIFRYCHPNKDHCSGNVLRDDLDSPDRIFSNFGADRYTIHLDHILKGTYVMKSYRINRHSGNLWAAWKELGFLYPKDAVTSSELLEASSPVPRTSVKILREDEPFEMSVTLQGNEVLLLSLELYTSHI